MKTTRTCVIITKRICISLLRTLLPALLLPVFNGFGQQPANDHFSAATVISGASGPAVGTNVGATAEPGEPDHLEDQAWASVWWAWTAPANGVVTFDTFGSGFDTVLAIYTGESVGGLTLVADNDDADDDTYQSAVSFAAVAGTTYRIMVDGYQGDIGSIALRWAWTEVPGEELTIGGISKPADGTFRFVVSGPPGIPGRIQRTTGMDAWEDWITFALAGGSLEIVDADAGTRPTRFYRADSP